MARRAGLRIRRAPEQMLDAILIPVVFTLLFTYVFGGALAGSPRAYLGELLPGTLVMSVLLMTVFGGVGLNADKSQGRLDRFRALPMWPPAVVVGGLLAEVVRMAVCAALVIALGTAMGFRPDGGPIGVLAGCALLLVFASAVSWVWAAIGLRADSPQTVSVLSFALFFPLTFASNAFVSPATMPDWLRPLVEANPISHLVTAERHLMAGHATSGDIAGVLLAAVVIGTVFAAITMRTYRNLG